MSERKIVKVSTAICQGNSTGYKLSFEDEMLPGETIFQETDLAEAVQTDLAEAVQKPWKKTK